jgi:NitT/TauT family transport system substrate-binding protein
MQITRRTALRSLAAAGALPFPALAQQAPRPLRINLLGFALGIHVPTMSAINEGLPELGYKPETTRMDQMRTLTQTLVAGAADLGETDPITVSAAVEQGADLKIVGLFYNSTSLVYVANADKVQDLKDLANPQNVVAVNNKGDTTHVLLVGPLLERKIDPNKVNIVEIGGSGARMKALLSGRVHAVPMHFDQAAAVAKQGNYKVLVEPWKEYKTWINECWVTSGSWLKQKDNARAVVDVLKATVMAFRKANEDLAWYTDAYKKYATLPDAKDATEESLRPLWEGLRNINAWPRDMKLDVEAFRELVPVYRQAGAVSGKVKMEEVVEPSFAQQAVSELGG